jgi:hypothetical protein
VGPEFGSGPPCSHRRDRRKDGRRGTGGTLDRTVLEERFGLRRPARHTGLGGVDRVEHCLQRPRLLAHSLLDAGPYGIDHDNDDHAHP